MDAKTTSLGSLKRIWLFTVLSLLAAEMSAQTLRIDSLNTQISQSYAAGDYLSSMQLLLALRSEYTAVRDTGELLLTRIRMADINRVLGNFNSALQDLNAISREAIELGLQEKYITAQFLKASIYFELEEHRKSIEISKKALGYNVKDARGKNMAYTVMGAAYGDLGSDSALYFLQLAIDGNVAIGDSANLSLPYSNLANFYGTQRKDYQQSLIYAQTAFDLAKKEGVPMYQLLAVRQMGTAFSELGDYKRAYECEKTEGELVEKMFSGARRLQFEILNDRIQTERKRAEDLENKNKLQAQRQRIVLLQIVVAATLLVLLLLAYALYINYKSNQRHQLHLKELAILNARIQYSNEILEKSNRVKDIILSVLGHDLRAPLGQTVALSELLRMQHAGHEETVELCSLLQQAGESGLGMLDNLLFWTRRQIENLEPDFRAIHPEKVLHDTITQIKTSVARKGLSIVTRFEEVPLLTTDPVLLQVVVRNLLSNACKFSPLGSEIIVGMRCCENNLCITIEDSGAGISNEVLQLINEGRINRPEQGTMGEKGAGIGLLLSRELLDMLHGKLTYSCPPNGGTIAQITLPIAK